MPARLRSCPTSCSTCTDTLTLVAVNAAARKRVAGAGMPLAIPNATPAPKGSTTPPMAPKVDALPTLSIWAVSVSRPAMNISSRTPM